MVPRDAEPQRGGARRPARDGPALRQRPGRHAPPGGVPQAPAARRRERTARPRILFNGGVFQPAVAARAAGRGDAPLVRPARPAVAAAGADQPVARPGRRLGRGLLRLAAAHRRPAHRRRHRPVVLHRRRGERSRRRPGRPRPSSASCRSTWKKGRRSCWTKPELELALGQPVLFPLYTSTVRGDDKAGDVLTVAPEQLLQLPPLHTVLRGGKRSGTKHVPVTLAARSHGDRHAGTVLRGQGRQQPLAAGVQRPRHGQGRRRRGRRAGERDADGVPSPTSGRRRRCRRRRG